MEEKREKTEFFDGKKATAKMKLPANETKQEKNPLNE